MVSICICGRWFAVIADETDPWSRIEFGSDSCWVRAAVAAWSSAWEGAKISIVTDVAETLGMRSCSWSSPSASAMSARRFCLNLFWVLDVVPYNHKQFVKIYPRHSSA